MASPPLVELLLPADVRARIEELVRSDPHVRALAMILGPHKIHEWGLTLGTLVDPVLRGLAPPLPDAELRRITADDEAEMFLWTGLCDVHAFLALLGRHLQSLPDDRRPRLLDFGCGCGRLLRFLRGTRELELHGVDVNASHVEWCRTHLAPITFTATSVRPPLPFAPGHFDGLWSLSVFTHLDERAGRAWRAELARVLAPGGILIATVQGETALAKAEADPELARRLGWDSAHRARARAALAESGHGFVRYDATSLAAARAGHEYGLHYTTEDHVRRHWQHDGLELLEYCPGELRGWQDVVVLRRSPG